MRKNKIEYMIDVAKHEIIHALVSYLLDVTCILKCIGYPSSNMRSIYYLDTKLFVYHTPFPPCQGFSKWSLPFYRDQNGRPRTKRDPVTKEPPNVNGYYFALVSMRPTPCAMALVSHMGLYGFQKIYY